MAVKLYSTEWNPQCVELKKFLKNKKVKFQEFNVAKDTRAAIEMINKSRQSGVPVLDINGKVIIGFNKKAIEKLLKK